jgi:hypothetical protein
VFTTTSSLLTRTAVAATKGWILEARDHGPAREIAAQSHRDDLCRRLPDDMTRGAVQDLTVPCQIAELEIGELVSLRIGRSQLILCSLS